MQLPYAGARRPPTSTDPRAHLLQRHGLVRLQRSLSTAHVLRVFARASTFGLTPIRAALDTRELRRRRCPLRPKFGPDCCSLHWQVLVRSCRATQMRQCGTGAAQSQCWRAAGLAAHPPSRLVPPSFAAARRSGQPAVRLRSCEGCSGLYAAVRALRWPLQRHRVVSTLLCRPAALPSPLTYYLPHSRGHSHMCAKQARRLPHSMPK
jgi:hypothetical protein